MGLLTLFVKKEPNVKSLSLKKALKDTSVMEFDLLYLLSYMSVIAAAGVPRRIIFERAAQLPCVSAQYFKKIELSSKQLKY
ncbi:MAG: hypothetical protein PHE50_09540, partial [Dehalococcoidales bacterium]|nr:hypothetical protein [Dehalococcoidales bacterium]